MRRISLSVILLLLLTISFSAAHAQEGRVWYWAITIEEGTLYAYAPDGETHAIMETPAEPGNTRAWRFAPDTALAILRVDDKPGLYHLTNETSTPVQIPEELNEENGGSIDDTRLAAHNADYGVLVSTSPVSAPALLVNLKTDQAQWLSGQVSGLGINRNNIVFSADGNYLRYLSHADERSTDWSIIERKLATGDERTIHTLSADPYAPIVWTDSTGDNWLYLQPPAEGETSLTYKLVTPAGLDRDVATETRESGKVWGLVADHLMSYSLLCEKDCPVEVQSLDGSTTLEYKIAERESATGFSPLILRENNDLIVLAGEVFWRLSSDGTSEKLGEWTPVSITNPISPDGRWLVMFDSVNEPTTYQVWDTQTGETAISETWDKDDHILITAYGDGGFIISEDALRFWLHRYSDGANIELPGMDFSYLAPLADGTVLANRLKPTDDEPRGIYHYNPDTQEWTLILQDVIGIYVEE